MLYGIVGRFESTPWNCSKRTAEIKKKSGKKDKIQDKLDQKPEEHKHEGEPSGCLEPDYFSCVPVPV